MEFVFLEAIDLLLLMLMLISLGELLFGGYMY
jgi:hypothetical protein